MRFKIGDRVKVISKTVGQALQYSRNYAKAKDGIMYVNGYDTYCGQRCYVLSYRTGRNTGDFFSEWDVQPVDKQLNLFE